MIVARLGRALSVGKLSLEKRGSGPPRWVLDWRGGDGRRHRRALSTDRRTAERMRAEVIRARDLEAAGLGSIEGQSKTFEDVARDYISDLRTRVTPHHLRNVSDRLDKLVERIGSRRIRDLRPLEIVRLRSEAVDRGLAPRTANLLGDTAKAVLNWGVQNQVIAENPLQYMKRLPDGPGYARRVRRALSEDEYRQLLDAADEDDRKCARIALLEGRTRVPQRIAFQVLVETGMRWGEARLLRWGDVDLNERVVVVRAEHAKSRRQRVVPVNQGLAEELRSLRVLHERVLRRLPTAAERVFLSPDGLPWGRPTTNPMRVFVRLLIRARIPKVDVEGRRLDLHALRATCGTRLARAGVGLVQAQRILGHSDPKLTARHYTLVDLDDLRSALEYLPPRPAGPVPALSEAAAHRACLP